MSFTLHLSLLTRKQLYLRLQKAYGQGDLPVVRRIQALLALADGHRVQDVAEMLNLGHQTIRDCRNGFLLKGISSLAYKRPPGRPSKLTKSQRQELATLIKAGPQAAGYTSGGWNTPMIQDLIQRRFGVLHHSHYLATLLHNLGFSYHKARFVSDHLNAKIFYYHLVDTPVLDDDCSDGCDRAIPGEGFECDVRNRQERRRLTSTCWVACKRLLW